MRCPNCGNEYDEAFSSTCPVCSQASQPDTRPEVPGASQTAQPAVVQEDTPPVVQQPTQPVSQPVQQYAPQPPQPYQQPQQYAAPPQTYRPPAPLVAIHVREHGLFVRALYFLFIGWWFGLFWALLSWFMYATIIGAPLGAVMMNKVPGAISLKSKQKDIRVVTTEDGYTVSRVGKQQFPLWARILYYPVGLVLSLVMIILGWLLFIFLITAPLGVMVFNAVPAVTSLHR